MNKSMYKVSQSTGKMLIWFAKAEGKDVIVSYGELGGKLQVRSYIAQPKNIGKVNYTTSEEQAFVELEALYEDRYNNKHYRSTVEDAVALDKTCKTPRKVHNFKDHADKLPEEVYFSVKLNGSRACILKGDLFSKIGRKETIKVKHIKEAIKELGEVNMDCEVYAHGLPLQRIRSAWLKPVRTDKEVCEVANKHFNLKGKDRITIPSIAINKLGYNPNEDASKLKLFVFDIPVTGIPFKERDRLVDELEEKVEELGLQDTIVTTTRYLINKKDVIYTRDNWHEKGYEGGVIYSPEDMYEFGKRSYTCQKTKKRLDSEALVLGCTPDKSGQGVLLLQTNQEMGSITFKAKMRGDSESRAFGVQKGFIGKWVNYSYEELSSKSVPTKPVVHETRLCDTKGNPQE